MLDYSQIWQKSHSWHEQMSVDSTQMLIDIFIYINE